MGPRRLECCNPIGGFVGRSGSDVPQLIGAAGAAATDRECADVSDTSGRVRNFDGGVEERNEGAGAGCAVDFEGGEIRLAVHARARALLICVVAVDFAGNLAEFADAELAAPAQRAVDAWGRAFDAAAAQLEQDLGINLNVGGCGFGLQRGDAGHVYTILTLASLQWHHFFSFTRNKSNRNV